MTTRASENPSMFEMKNEGDETASKKYKNAEQFFKEFD